jgi:hypothetical protein
MASQQAPAVTASPPKAAFVSPKVDDKMAVHLPDPEPVEKESMPAAQLMRFATGTALRQDQGVFEVLRLRAISKYSYNSNMGNLVDEKMNLVFFDPAIGAKDAMPMTFPVVMKMSNGQLGIISGTLIVTMKNIQEAGTLGQRFGLSLKAQDDTLAMAYFAAPKVDRINDLIADLRLDPSVKSVQAEIVQSWKKQR